MFLVLQRIWNGSKCAFYPTTPPLVASFSPHLAFLRRSCFPRKGKAPVIPYSASAPLAPAFRLIIFSNVCRRCVHSIADCRYHLKPLHYPSTSRQDKLLKYLWQTANMPQLEPTSTPLPLHMPREVRLALADKGIRCKLNDETA